MAADRTLMAWIRTSLSLIGFGFGIGKAYEYLKSAGLRDPADPIRNTLIFGTTFISLGMLTLLAAVIQHTRILQRLEAPDYASSAMHPITRFSGGGRLPGRDGDRRQLSRSDPPIVRGR